MYSDNGTNFVGVVKVLHEHKFTKAMSNWLINWNFNPPCSPWMGGIYESMVKITKKCLGTVITDKLFDEESLRTCLTEIESFMNSRPLTSLSNDVNDNDVLTTNHFLVGHHATPEIVEQDECSTRLKWRNVQSAVSRYWKLWTREYLPQLTKRSKWFKTKRSLQRNDVVIYVDNTLERKTWPIARVLEIY